jgi:nitrogenase molybdenum-iron protein beta chain
VVGWRHTRAASSSSAARKAPLSGGAASSSPITEKRKRAQRSCRVLEGIGLRVNVLFGPRSQGVKEWQAIPRAQFNLVLSPWLGLETARYLEATHDQPFLRMPVVPLGGIETSAFLREVGAFAGLPTAQVEAFIAAEEREYYENVVAFSEFYSQYRWGLPSKFVAIADSATTLALAKFVVRQLGLVPARLVVTDNPREEYREAIRAQFRTLDYDVSVEVDFAEDSFTIHQLAREADLGSRPPLILGSTWERDLAKELRGFVLEVGSPHPTRWCCRGPMSAIGARWH